MVKAVNAILSGVLLFAVSLEDYEAQVIVFSPGENPMDVPVPNDAVTTAILSLRRLE